VSDQWILDMNVYFLALGNMTRHPEEREIHETKETWVTHQQLCLVKGMGQDTGASNSVVDIYGKEILYEY
jgi:hypothetical protein